MKGMDKSGNWTGAHDRLEAGRDALERAFTPTAEQVQAVLRERAARLARAAPPDSTGEETGVLVFHAGGDRFAIELDRLAGVVAAGPCSPVPGAPPELAGVMQLRGQICPVWEASRLLGREQEEAGAHVLLLYAGERQIGVRVGGALEIRHVTPGQRLPAKAQPPWVRYLLPDLVAVLDADELLKQGLS